LYRLSLGRTQARLTLLGRRMVETAADEVFAENAV
jgi:hypothetical protein